MVQQQIQIGIFLDGRPGHQKQTYGILAALQERQKAAVIKRHVARAGVIPRFLQYCSLISPFPAKADSELRHCNLLLGTGTQTHLPMLLAKKALNIPVVTCMTPAAYIRDDFDLIFSPFHDDPPERPNLIRTIGPPNPNMDRGKHSPDRILILLGGIDPKSHTWDSHDMVRCIEELAGKEKGKELIISSSPRTPDETCSMIDQLQLRFENIHFYPYTATPAGWIENEYALARDVWISADSVSMVYEALSAGCSVGILPVRWKSGKNKFREGLDYLARENRVVDFAAYLQGKWCAENSQPLNEAARCAEIIIDRIL